MDPAESAIVTTIESVFSFVAPSDTVARMVILSPFVRPPSCTGTLRVTWPGWA